MPYFTPRGGLPGQTELTTDRAMFTPAYAVLPARTMSDITTSYLPFWRDTRLWIIARPLTGFAETFSQYIVEVAPGGGSERPETDRAAEGVLFVVDGTLTLTLDGQEHAMEAGGYAFLAPGANWALRNDSAATATFHWVRKSYEEVEGIDRPESFVTSDAAVEPTPMVDTDGVWATTRFVEPTDVRHDMHVTIVTFQPGGAITFPETHVMEHGLYVLQGKAVYLLNTDWVEVAAGDFMWLRAYCPQACYAGGPEPFRYLLYKDVNRHPGLRPPFR